jgi:hypothetical protein
MKQIRFLFIAMIALLINACQNSSQPESENENMVYSTSFETESDISGWSGLTKENLADSACPEGKNHSLHISGGCIQPAASYEIPNVQPGKYKISFWGKMGQASQSAGLTLKQSGSSSIMDSVNTRVTSTTWKYYESEKGLTVASVTKLKLDVLVGGIIFADVFIDNLKIERIN